MVVFCGHYYYNQFKNASLYKMKFCLPVCALDHFLSYNEARDVPSQPRENFNQRTTNAYSEALKKGSLSSNQFKLVTLGAEGAVKNSTINTLMGES